MKKSLYTWEEIKPIAEELDCEMNGMDYHVWSTAAEMEWAETSWKMLMKNGLCFYESPGLCSKAYVELQILTLAAMYCKFTGHYFKSDVIIDYYLWFLQAEINIAVLENIVNKNLTDCWKEKMAESEIEAQYTRFREDFFDQEVTVVYESESQDKIAEAIKNVINEQSPQVYSALRNEHKSSFSLYSSLQKSQCDTDCFVWVDEGMLPSCSIEYIKKLA
jgi:hypothetical protein